MRYSLLFLALVQGVLGFEWLKAGLDKLSQASYVSSTGKTLSIFASKNPFSWYGHFLTGTGVPHANVLAVLVEYGELLVGIALLASAAILLLRVPATIRVAASAIGLFALIVAVFMSANYWLAAGWTSSSTDGLNMVMGVLEIGLVLTVGLTLLEGQVDRDEPWVRAPQETMETRSQPRPVVVPSGTTPDSPVATSDSMPLVDKMATPVATPND